MASSLLMGIILPFFILGLIPCIFTQDTTTTTTTTAITTVIQAFFIGPRIHQQGEEGSSRTWTWTAPTPKISGSVVGVDTVSNLTTIVVTRTAPTRTTGGYNTRRPALFESSLSFNSRPTPPPHHGSGRDHDHDRAGNNKYSFNTTVGRAMTITQGPETVMFTGVVGYGDRTLVNRCTLNGTTSAGCNVTFLGGGTKWHDTRGNGETTAAALTHSYNWTLSGDNKFGGWAPVTVTAGGELLLRESGTASSISSSSSASIMKAKGGWMLGGVVSVVMFWVGLLW
ncbi:hypothetical protein QBC38DRAFT_544883 [Podospora fimiseda]|uniref:Uncharacterized protein n=1 Tax=Podospora fimiseda TaxID=252190 RepID=A0AAN7BQI3_9PEZI|nr:hypothetical protein QBC38DRAFT_544883 [Podospora fimiseda]